MWAGGSGKQRGLQAGRGLYRIKVEVGGVMTSLVSWNKGLALGVSGNLKVEKEAERGPHRL